MSVTTGEVMAFFDEMNADMKEMRDMLRTEENLMNAVQEYEKVWKVKIKVVNEPTESH